MFAYYPFGNNAALEVGDANGQILFWDTNKWFHTETNEVVWDDANKRLGIGVVAPTATLDINSNLAINNTSVIYLPNQTNFNGTVFFGTGGAFLSHTGGSEGQRNTAVGIGSLNATTTGLANTALGYGALSTLTTGSYNTAFGNNALLTVNASYNTAIGSDSLKDTINGQFLTVVGVGALTKNTNGNSDVAIGVSAGSNKQTGDDNIFIGRDAGLGTGVYNTQKNIIIGKSAGAAIATGALNNILIGWSTGDNITTGHDNMIIGHDLDAPVAAGNNQLAIGGVIVGNLANGALGYGAETKVDKRAQQTLASGKFAAAGDAQGSNLIVRRSVVHSDANWYELFLDGASEQLLIASDTVWTFDVLLVGTTSGCTKSFGFKIEGVIENDGGVTTMLVSNVATLYDTDDVSFDVRATADNGTDALKIEVTDADSTGDTVRWVAKISTAEVTF